MRVYLRIIFLLLLICLSENIFSQTGGVQDNPVLAVQTSNPPVVDGLGNDLCWQSAKWQSIGQVWVPYNGTVSNNDYSGRYKVIWSSSTNLLYFLIEINDDVIVDGYKSANGTCYNYDISEVFIDENHSGGEHRYDGATTNAENAFAYHMYCDYPADGQVVTTPYIEDMYGTQATSKWVERNSHFPAFALRKSGNTAVREFSLIVYNDTYVETNKDASRVKLEVDKEMGLSVAYCDNDGVTENPKVRDNMFGSVAEPSPGNMHWMNANYFGRVKLVSENSTAIEKNNLNETPAHFTLEQNYPNPFNPTTTINYSVPQSSFVTIKIYDLVGREIETLVKENNPVGNYSIKFDGSNLPSGAYFYLLQANTFTQARKFLLIK